MAGKYAYDPSIQCEAGDHPFTNRPRDNCFAGCSCWCHYFVDPASTERREAGAYAFWEAIPMEDQNIFDALLNALNMKEQLDGQPD